MGGGTLRDVGEVVKSLGATRPLIVTDRFLTKNGVAAIVSDALFSAGCVPAHFNETVPDPTTMSLEIGVEILKDHRADIVIGLGGGSPIDTAKALAVLAVRGGSMQDLKAPVRYDGPALPVVAIPTTAGTGSEATQTTVITDRSTREKMLCMGPSFLPKAAIIDYELTLSMPPRLTADTGIDALTHAVEAYVSTQASSSTDVLALDAIGKIGAHLRAVCRDGSNRESREAMMEAAHTAGVAFANSSVALVHAMSRPLGAHFRVAHGMANAMLFAAVTEFSLGVPGVNDARYADCARALGVAGAETADVDAAAALVAELHALARDLAVPTPEAFGISSDDWAQATPVLAAQAIASGSHLNNPRIPTQNEIEGIYARIFARS